MSIRLNQLCFSLPPDEDDIVFCILRKLEVIKQGELNMKYLAWAEKECPDHNCELYKHDQLCIEREKKDF